MSSFLNIALEKLSNPTVFIISCNLLSELNLSEPVSFIKCFKYDSVLFSKAGAYLLINCFKVRFLEASNATCFCKAVNPS